MSKLFRLTLAIAFVFSTLPLRLGAQICCGCQDCFYSYEWQDTYQGSCQGANVNCAREETDSYCDCGYIQEEWEEFCGGQDSTGANVYCEHTGDWCSGGHCA